MPSFYLFRDETLVLRFQIKDANNSIYLPSESNINLSYQSDCGTGEFSENTSDRCVYFFFKPNISANEIGYLTLHLNGTVQIGNKQHNFHDTEKIYLLFKDVSK